MRQYQDLHALIRIVGISGQRVIYLILFLCIVRLAWYDWIGLSGDSEYISKKISYSRKAAPLKALWIWSNLRDTRSTGPKPPLGAWGDMYIHPIGVYYSKLGSSDFKDTMIWNRSHSLPHGPLRRHKTDSISSSWWAQHYPVMPTHERTTTISTKLHGIYDESTLSIDLVAL